ncbi:MAG: hypothetical protein ACK5MV_08630 [Aminipila sp.]
MGTNIFKIVSLFVIMMVSLQTSGAFVEKHVIDVKHREKTLADAMLKKEMEEKLLEAEKHIEKVQAESNIEIKTENVEMKPIEEQKTDENRDEEEQKNGADTLVTEENSINSKYQQVVEGLKSGVELGEKDLKLLGDFLIDNYFLNGKNYISKEQNQELKDKKILVNRMESYVIKSLNYAMDILNIIVNKNYSQITDIKNNLTAQGEEFYSKFSYITNEDLQYKKIYEDINNYFSSCIDAVTKVENIINTAENTTNPTLAAGVVMAGIDKDVIPSFKQILNRGIDIKENINSIYLEGMEKIEILTKEQVLNIISLI